MWMVITLDYLSWSCPSTWCIKYIFGFSDINSFHSPKWRACRVLFQESDHPKIFISPRPSYFQIFWVKLILMYLCPVPPSVPLWLANKFCSLFFQLMEIIPSTSQTLLHSSLNFLKTAIPRTYWTNILQIQLTPNVQLLQAYIIL